MSSTIRDEPAAKRQRLTKDATTNVALPLQSLPLELLLQVLTYSDRSDVAAVCRVCHGLYRTVMSLAELWKELALRSHSNNTVLQDVFQSLRRGQEQPISLLRDDAALWRRLWASFERASVRALEEGRDYHSVTNEGLPVSLPPDWIQPLDYYSFAIHIWGVDGIKQSQTVPRARFGVSSIQLDLGQSSSIVGQLFQSGEFHALEIEIFSPGPTVSSAILYSSFNPLEAYGGGNFEEYAAMPWFEVEGREDSDPELCPERYDWLPFVLVHPSLPTNTFTVLNVELQWHSRGVTGKRQDKYKFISRMNTTEILTVLKHRRESTSSSEEPRCFVVQPMLPTRDYQPKPLSSYSFIVEMKNLNDPTKNCSFFCDQPKCGEDGMVRLFHFEIPTRYDEFFPYDEEFQDPNETLGRRVEIHQIITVFVIDRCTGLQAKLYESKPDWVLWECFDMGHFFCFEKCAALTQFSNGRNANSIPVPAVRGFLDGARKDNDPPDTTRSIDVHFEFLNYKAGNPRTDAAVQSVHFTIMDALAFLEKGLTYK